MGDGYPGYSGQIPKNAAMFAEVLRQGGYSTAFIGKNHNIADWETSISGPFDRWPSLQGFDYFYGFIGGEMASGSRLSIAALRRLQWRSRRAKRATTR